MLLVSLSNSIIHNPLRTSYQASIYYPSKVAEFDHHRENHWAEIYFFYDSQCSLSTTKKSKLENYFKQNRTIGSLPKQAEQSKPPL